MSTWDDEIVGRAAELAAVRHLVDAAPAGTRALEIHGEHGIGKTLLWRDALGRARDLGYAVLTTRCYEEEMSGALVGLADLFEDVAVHPSALASDTDPLGRGRVVLDAVRRMSREAPLLVGIDDLQWLDPGTARILRYVLRRLDDQPVALLVTVRTGPAGHNASDGAPGSVSSIRATNEARPSTGSYHSTSSAGPSMTLRRSRRTPRSARYPRSARLNIALGRAGGVGGRGWSSESTHMSELRVASS